MKIYIGYRYTGADKVQLKAFLTKVSSVLEHNQHKTFLYFRDGGNWENKEGKIPLDKVIKESILELKSSNACLFLVQSNDFSEGMLLDIGCAISHNIPLYLALKDEARLPKTESLATKIIHYTNDYDLLNQLKNI